MRVLLWIAAAIAMSLLATDSPTIAHHASAAFYDGNQSVEIQGSVTKFVFRNPHSFLYVDATDENGQTVGWEIEMGPCAAFHASASGVRGGIRPSGGSTISDVRWSSVSAVP